MVEGGAVLRNRAGLTDPDELEAFEVLSVTQRSEEPLPDGTFDEAHFRAVHRHLFQDVYDWAGAPRTIRMFKDNSPFGYPENFDRELVKLFGGLRERHFLQGRDPDAFAAGAANFLGELNAIHLFREGNGRAQTAFLAMLAAEAGHPLDLARIDPQAWMTAMVRSFYGKEAQLAAQIRVLIVD
ncbi:MAG TPA: Fic family protein [Caulobacteraceae bacterium]